MRHVVSELAIEAQQDRASLLTELLRESWIVARERARRELDRELRASLVLSELEHEVTAHPLCSSAMLTISGKTSREA